jgi:hypothetical protein
MASDTAAMMKINPADFVTTVRDRPIPKDPLNFFNFQSSSRVFVNITDSTSVWQTDLVLAERLFADMIVCPFNIEKETHEESIRITKDILKQRMKYPSVKETPDYEMIAKTWVLPGKVHSGPDAPSLLEHGDMTLHEKLEPFFKGLNITNPVIHLLKIEVSNGIERQFIFKVLDSGFRPSIILVKWSNDLDEHYATAHCAGHLVNSGYSLVGLENGYGLYIFSEQTLYDICSMKTIGIQNPIMVSLIQSCTGVSQSIDDSSVETNKTIQNETTE